jgi:hypothetical protein
MIVGASGSSGLGWSELKDIECHHRFMLIKAEEEANRGGPRIPSAQDAAYERGIFMHAARAKWLELGQHVERSYLEQCYDAGRTDCEKQGFPISELTAMEYALLFTNYANYWAIRPKIKPYAVELFLEYDLATTVQGLGDGYLRTTRLDDFSYYPDVDGFCIGEFKNTFDLSGATKFYNERNPQILLQQLIVLRQSAGTVPEFKGTMADIWDNGKLRGTRHFIPLNTSLLAQFERWLERTLHTRKSLLHGMSAVRNFMVCNTFNDAYKTQCKYREKCGKEGKEG